jgi:hypothetical protein
MGHDIEIKNCKNKKRNCYSNGCKHSVVDTISISGNFTCTKWTDWSVWSMHSKTGAENLIPLLEAKRILDNQGYKSGINKSIGETGWTVSPGVVLWHIERFIAICEKWTTCSFYGDQMVTLAPSDYEEDEEDEETRDKRQETRDKRQEARDKRQETRDKRQEARDKRQETRDKRQEARDKRQETRDKRQEDEEKEE